MKISNFLSNFLHLIYLPAWIGLTGAAVTIAVPVRAEIIPVAQAPNSSSRSSSWQDFISETGRYSVQLPNRPSQFTSTTAIPEGTLTWQVAEVRIPPTEQSGTEYYLIAYTDLSADHLAQHQPDEIIQAVTHAVMSEGGLEGSIQRQEPILFHDHPARLVIGAVKDQYWVMVLSLVNGRLYTNLAFSKQRDRMVHFLDSFAFTDRATATPASDFAAAVWAVQ